MRAEMSVFILPSSISQLGFQIYSLYYNIPIVHFYCLSYIIQIPALSSSATKDVLM